MLDASALLALLNHESGAERVASSHDASSMSTVNWAEVAQKMVDRDVARGPADVRQDLVAMGLQLRDFTAAHAEIAAAIWPSTRALGLSLADRACLALALEISAQVLTADRAWATLGLDIDVQVIR